MEDSGDLQGGLLPAAAAAGGGPALGVDARRWGVLALALAMGSMQGASWIVFSASDRESRTMFALGQRGSLVLDWVMNVGTIAFVLALPLFTRALERRGARRGLHFVMTVAGCHLGVLAAALRCAAVAARGSRVAVPLLFASAIVNGASSPGFYFSSAVAELWFPETERFLALSLLAVPGTVGPLVAFLSALFVDSPGALATLVYADALAVAALAAAWIAWCPVHPTRPPSAAAARDFEDAPPAAKRDGAPLVPDVPRAVWVLCGAAGLYRHARSTVTSAAQGRQGLSSSSSVNRSTNADRASRACRVDSALRSKK